jgi:hypothetical protein
VKTFGYSGSCYVSSDARRKTYFLAEKRSQLFSWKPITAVNYLDSPFKAVNLQPATALNYVGLSFQAIQRIVIHWDISTYLSKLSSLQPVPSLSYRHSPFQAVQLMTVTELSHRGSRFESGIPPIRFVFQVTQKDLRRSLMMASYCRNMWEPVYRIKEWYKSVHSVGYFYYVTVNIVNISWFGTTVPSFRRLLRGFVDWVMEFIF